MNAVRSVYVENYKSKECQTISTIPTVSLGFKGTTNLNSQSKCWLLTQRFDSQLQIHAYMKTSLSDLVERTPSTVPSNLAEMRQSNNDTRELHGMVTHAFPGTDFEMQDQLAVKAFV